MEKMGLDFCILSEFTADEKLVSGCSELAIIKENFTGNSAFLKS